MVPQSSIRRYGKQLADEVADLLHMQITIRLLTGFALTPIIIVLVLEGGIGLAVLVAIILVAAVYELTAGMGMRSRDPILYVTASGVIAMIFAISNDMAVTLPFTACVLAIAATPILEEIFSLRRAQKRPAAFTAIYQRVALGIFAIVYIGWLGSFFLALRQLQNGEEWLLLAISAVMATDTGAYFFGRTLGRRKFAARISPAKTVEGAIGGVISGFTAVILINLLPDLEVTLWKMVILGILIPCIAQIGDLTESVLKRSLDVKDFSQLIPGHGGVLDRLDSLLFGVPAVYCYLIWVIL